ncbi:MAG: inositol monophosphatase [Planctomycetaceae bacterium]|nr:inositol monophosphatase [Planctomycetaceae bacterium]
MHPEFEVAKRAAEAGAEVISQAFERGVAVRNKAVSDLVTDADLESEQAIARVIREAFPDHAILGEETFHDDASAENLWVVDPLDGTTNFAHGISHFAVSIAYYHQGEPVCGVITNPITQDWYTAIRNEGAFANGEPVHVTKADTLGEVLVGVGFYYDRGAMMEATLAAIRDLFREQIHGIRRFGTASLDLVQVGMGRYAAFFEYELSPWDFAAGRLFVTEAGGRVTTCNGMPLPMAKTSVLASNDSLHDAVLGIVGSHVPK